MSVASNAMVSLMLAKVVTPPPTCTNRAYVFPWVKTIIQTNHELTIRDYLEEQAPTAQDLKLVYVPILGRPLLLLFSLIETKQVELMAKCQKKRRASTAPLKSRSSRPNLLPPQRQLLRLREGGNLLSSKYEDDEHDADAYQDK
ncbi:uncharacterized protein LOC124672579 isoform X2 [Lolium rigidum]|uniref:uncharacterized protein LOC124672579 isoform X2 n=1 Tax=Lolium rigidum TaxID=89674 RepID=UPI001F5CFA3D|nr:uncharacterized protein LOC124672579 isoform X2 [Lolium rigidum]